MQKTKLFLDTKALERKTVLLTFTLILIVSIASQILISYNFSTIIDKKIASRKSMANLLYNKFMQEHFSIHKAILDSYQNSLDIENAIKSNDRDKLHNILSDRYKAISTGFPNLNVLHFVTPKNISFLRMHKPENFGDDLSDVRPMHVFANKNLTLLHGIEVGKYGISLRSISPIIYNAKHYATLEVGTALEDVIKELQEVMDIKILLTLENSKLKISRLKRLKKYNNSCSILFSSDLFTDLHPNLKNTTELKYKGRNYMLYKGIDLFSFNGEKVGQFFYAIDVTNELIEKNHYIILSSIITMILLFFVYIILHVNFSKMSQKLHLREHYSQLILNSQKNIVILSNGKEIIDANRSFLNFFSYKTLEDFKKEHQCICDFFKKNSKDDFVQGHQYKGINWTEYVIKNRDKDLKCQINIDNIEYIFSIHATSTKVYNEQLSVLIFTDITPLMHENANLQKLSYTDKLTQIHNRQSFDLVMKQIYTKSKLNDKVFSIIFFDIDHFKRVNDNYGHKVGDDVLKEITSCISSKIRSDDSIFRWGGEEFIIILPNTSQDIAFIISEKLRIYIEDKDIETVGKITCSFGVSDNRDSKTVSEIIEDADKALYKAKESGRNRVVMAMDL